MTEGTTKTPLTVEELWLRLGHADPAHCARMMYQRATDLELALAAAEQAQKAAEERPVEVWKGNRKVTIYPDMILRSWGIAPDHIQWDEFQRSLDTVQESMDWLYADQATRELAGVRERTVEECAKVCEALREGTEFKGNALPLEVKGYNSGIYRCAAAIRALSPLPIQDADKEKS